MQLILNIFGVILLMCFLHTVNSDQDRIAELEKKVQDLIDSPVTQPQYIVIDPKTGDTKSWDAPIEKNSYQVPVTKFKGTKS